MAIYHLNVSAGTRQGGQSAAAKADYIGRAGRYKNDRAEVALVESANMPGWVESGRGRAAGAALDYWRQADAAERANGVLFREVEGALPHELTLAESVALARRIADQLAQVNGGVLPYTLAIHDKPGNRHLHLVLSERVNDGIERDRDQWFKRAANRGKDPATGGASKADLATGRGEWLANARQLWQDLTNDALAAANRPERIDHRSLKEQGSTRTPGVHIGPRLMAIHEAKSAEEVLETISRGREYAAPVDGPQVIQAAQEVAALTMTARAAQERAEAAEKAAHGWRKAHPFRAFLASKTGRELDQIAIDQAQQAAMLQAQQTAAAEHEARVRQAQQQHAEREQELRDGRLYALMNWKLAEREQEHPAPVAEPVKRLDQEQPDASHKQHRHAPEHPQPRPEQGRDDDLSM